MISFVGAAGGDAELNSTVLRRGKAMSFVRSSVTCEGGLATEGVFAFGAPRETTALKQLSSVPPPPESLFDVTVDTNAADRVPSFLKNFEMRMVRGAPPASDADVADNMFWIRHVGASEDGAVPGVHKVLSLLAVADVPFPALFSAAKTMPKGSTATWGVNILDPDAISAEGGWWLLRSRAEQTYDGYCSQDMTIWGRSMTTPVALSRQTVAFYL
jgi:hypothetical protein